MAGCFENISGCPSLKIRQRKGEEYDIYESTGLAMRSSRHRAKLEEYYAELALNGELDDQNGLTVEQARRIQIKIRKFDKEDEQALQAAHV